jgi:ATP-dependent helicase HrpA
MPAVTADVTAQLTRLMPAGYLLVTPWARVREFPRYLRALRLRLDKAGQDAARDAKLVNEAQQWELRYWAAVKSEQGRLAPEDDPFRWLLEEYRVSLFAQQVGTAMPVSAKRLAEAWTRRAAPG